MKFYLLFLILSFNVVASPFQYPEDRTYTSDDHGLRPYRALSLYKTGTFVLTFDDGPHPTRTAQLLDVLKKHEAKAIFFVLTSQITEENAYLIKRMLDEGHLVGSHGVTHDRASDLPQDVWKARIKQSFLDLAKWYHKAGYALTKPYYRFPYGNYGTRSDYHHINALKEVSKELMGDNCIQMAFWDVDTADWVPTMTAEEVANNIIVNNEGGTYIDFKREGNTYVKNPIPFPHPPAGGVILQHDIQEPTVKATDLFLQYAKDRGLHLPRIDDVEEFKITKNCQL